MASEERVAAIHGRAPDGVLDQVRVHVDMPVLEEQPEAGLTLQHVGKRQSQLRLARHTRGLGREPVEEGIDQRAGHILADGAAVIRGLAADAVLNLVERGNAQERLVHDGRARLGPGLNQLSSPMCPTKGELQRLAARTAEFGEMGIGAIGIDLDGSLEAREDVAGIQVIALAGASNH